MELEHESLYECLCHLSMKLALVKVASVVLSPDWTLTDKDEKAEIRLILAEMNKGQQILLNVFLLLTL